MQMLYRSGFRTIRHHKALLRCDKGLHFCVTKVADARVVFLKSYQRRIPHRNSVPHLSTHTLSLSPRSFVPLPLRLDLQELACIRCSPLT
jgi:hypothetical protein